jgi:acetoin utilization deacetylase AcuC-like enzyme
VKQIPVFFNRRMVAPASGYSPSAEKPPLVVDSWKTHKLPISIRDFKPVTLNELCLAHDASYVERVLSGVEENGFGTKDLEVARSLPYTSGAMLAAAKEALLNKKVAVAPVSGFHHAHWDSAGGFCTFNGLMVTALALQKHWSDIRVGILDLDQHWGDGTEDIINRTGADDWVVHISATQKYGVPSKAHAFLKNLSTIIKEKLSSCDIVLYQAGADCHVDDPLGGWLTTEQFIRRDQIVFEALSEINLPVAWNLAGGYQKPIQKVIKLHDITMQSCSSCYLET